MLKPEPPNMPTAPPPLPYASAVRPRPLKQPKGSQTRQETLKEGILLAAEYVGDEMAEDAAAQGKTRPGGLMGYLTMVAAGDVKAFCMLLGKVLPMQLAGADGGALEVTFRTVYEEALPKPSPPAAP